MPNVNGLEILEKIDRNENYKTKIIITSGEIPKFNFNFASQFYHYLFLVIKKLLYRPFVLNDAYKEIALEQDITAKNVKWGIKKLVTSMVRYASKEVLSQYISYTPSPSPKVFISEIIKLTRKKA